MSNQQKAINGAKWTSVATLVTVIFAFFQLAVIARVLPSSAFGLVAMSTITINFFHIFANLGFANSIISHQESEKSKLSTIFYSSLSLGVIIFLIINLFAYTIASYFNEPRLVHIIRISSYNFPLIYAGQIYGVLLQKELKFKSLAIIDVTSSLFATIFTIYLAHKNFEEMSLIYGEVLYTLLKTLLFVLVGIHLFKPMLYFNLREIKDHLQFGIYNMGQGVLGYASGNIETLMIGKLLGAPALGLYTIAYQLAVYPIVRLNPIIMQVSYPLMAKISDDHALKRAYLKIVDFITYCNFPLLAGLFITAVTVVPLVYGNNWIDTIPLVQVIVFVSVLKCISAPVPSLAFTKGKPNSIFYITLIVFAIKLPIIYFLSKYFGLIGVAYGNLITTLFETLILLILVKQFIGNFLNVFLMNLYKPVLFCIIMILVISMYQYIFSGNELYHTFIQIILGGGIYVGLTLRFKISMQEILQIRKAI